MQVKAKINEARVSAVEAGMSAKIELDAFPDMKLTGTVEKVSEYPLPSAWYSGNVKEYETTIKIDSFPKDLEMRPGMTAKVSIRVEQIGDVLTVPVQAVFEHGGKYYCVLRREEDLEAREVTIGSTNDKEVVIEKGLDMGEQVVLGAALHRDKLDLPELVPEEETSLVAAPGDRPRPAQKSQAEGDGSQPARGGEGARGGAQRAGAGGAGGPGGRDRPNLSEAFKKLDADGNGRIEGGEIAGPMKANLSATDTNGDGAVDRSEFNAAIQKMRGGSGGPGAAKRPGGAGSSRPASSRGGQGARP